MPWHFWRVRKAGGVVYPHGEGDNPPERPDRVHTIPHLVTKEAAVALALIASIFLFSIFVDAPLQEMANPGMSPNPAKAPWYFLGTQELLLHFHPLFAVFIIPVIAGIAMILVPYFTYDTTTAGTWFVSARGRKMVLISMASALVFTLAAVLLSEYFIDLQFWLPGLPPEISNGLIPFAGVIGAVAGLYLLMKMLFDATRAESVQALFVFLFVAFVVLTVIGVWFRGEGMALKLLGGMSP
jgi:hypothetical protein